jgi:hypothetical protein
MKEIKMQIYFRSIFFLWLVTLVIRVWASDDVALIKAPEISDIEFKAYILSHASFTPVSRRLTVARPAANNAQELRLRFETAERSYIGADVATAYQAFVSLADLAFVDDWSEAQRATIFYAFLRAAQTAPNIERRNELLRAAARFNTKAEIDAKLFPPPLVEEFKIVKSEESLVPIILGRAFTAYSVALLNGEIIELKKFALRVPAGEFRITLISDSLRPVTRV